MDDQLCQYLNSYLQLRRTMGHRLADHRRLLTSFLKFLAAQHGTSITVDLALQWACLPQGTTAQWHAKRLSAVRLFAAHLHAVDPALADTIPPKLIRAPVVRSQPYIYTPDQIQALIHTAGVILQPTIRAITVQTVIGLMATTGMRISECLRLDTTDADLRNHQLTVTGKKDHQRVIPIHPTTAAALKQYLHTSRYLMTVTGDALFINLLGRRPTTNSMQTAFRTLTTSLDYQARAGGKLPRLHDLRHTYATNQLLDAHRTGADLDARVAQVATYLGHVSPDSTYWYLTAIPELMHLVANNVQSAHQGVVS